MKNIKCNICNKKYLNKHNLKNHLWYVHDIGSGEIYKCEYCDNYDTKRKGDLKSHLWYSHNIGNGEIYKCEHCDTFNTKNKSGLKEHLRCVHNIGEEKIYKCEHCDNCILKSNGSLKEHLWCVHDIGSGEIYKCEYCDKYETKRKGDLKSHLWCVHDIGNRKIYKCEYCDTFETKRKGDLKEHLWCVHDIGSGEIYKCKYCDKYETKRKKDLKDHLSSMHDIGDHKCEYCVKNVARISSYTCPITNMTSNICRLCRNKKETGFSTRKEEKMVNYLKEDSELAFHITLTDSIIRGDACNTKRRPDLLITSPNLNLIVECDENQHKDYDISCESGRLDEIFDELTSGKIVVIRWNPDQFKVNNKTISIKLTDRLLKLKNLIKEIIQNTNNIIPDNIPIQLYYMFYSDNSELFTDRWNITKIFQ